MLSDAEGIYASSASIWEAAIKAKLGKLDLDVDALVAAIVGSGFLELSVTAKHAAAVGRLPDLHSDPFDRLLIAQAMSEPLRFLTGNDVPKGYSELVELV